jgi:hypothetical protein
LSVRAPHYQLPRSVTQWIWSTPRNKTKLQNALPLLQALVLSFFIVVLSPVCRGWVRPPSFP